MSGPESDRKFITAVDGVPPSPSPISHAVVVGGTCWISGQLSVADDGSYRSGSARDEAARAFELVFRIAAAAGFSRQEIVYVDLALQNLDDLAEVNALFAALFPEGRRPARTVYEAARLPFSGKVKVQAIAARTPA
jgi:2-iminobutanoate/2-iminopropanoate deaminase